MSKLCAAAMALLQTHCRSGACSPPNAPIPPTPFDQTYYPDTIVRTMSMEEGYYWRVEAKNHSPDSEPDL